MSTNMTAQAANEWYEPLAVEWFDKTPPPWLQAWSDDDTPIGAQLARETQKERQADPVVPTPDGGDAA